MAFKIVSKDQINDFSFVKSEIKNKLVEFLGIYTLSKAGIVIFDEFYNNNIGIIKVNSKYVDHVKSALLFITKINNQIAFCSTIATSGMLNKIIKEGR